MDDQVDGRVGAAFKELAHGRPSLPADALERIRSRSRQRRARRVASAAVACAAVATLGIGVAMAARSAPSTQPAQPPGVSDWENLSGPALAEALDLDPVATDDIDETPSCDGKGAQEFRDGMAYCFLAEDYGITDPVDKKLLNWQLRGAERTPQLLELAQLEVELDEAIKVNTEQPSAAHRQAIADLTAETGELHAAVVDQIN